MTSSRFDYGLTSKILNLSIFQFCEQSRFQNCEQGWVLVLKFLRLFKISMESGLIVYTHVKYLDLIV